MVSIKYPILRHRLPFLFQIEASIVVYHWDTAILTGSGRRMSSYVI